MHKYPSDCMISLSFIINSPIYFKLAENFSYSCYFELVSGKDLNGIPRIDHKFINFTFFITVMNRLKTIPCWFAGYQNNLVLKAFNKKIKDL